MGFDTGPGNTLLDHWICRHKGEPFDRDGAWSASGRVHRGLLEQLIRHPYFQRTGPRSTGKEVFNLAWLDSVLDELADIPAQDVQATLLELTTSSIANAISDCPYAIAEIYICGGGCHNTHMMASLSAQLAPATVASTAQLGMDPDWVEAATFAWLAHRTLEGLAGNAEVVTGATGARVLGGVYWGAT